MEEKGEEEVAEEAVEEDEKHSEPVCPWEVARTAATFDALRPPRHCRLVTVAWLLLFERGAVDAATAAA